MRLLGLVLSVQREREHIYARLLFVSDQLDQPAAIPPTQIINEK
jgi:hypothetical protein